MHSADCVLEDTILFDKIYASMLAAAIGDAMGGPVEGWHYERIAATHGVVKTLLPYDDPPDFHAHFATIPGAITDDTRLKHILCNAAAAFHGVETWSRPWRTRTTRHKRTWSAAF